MRTLVAVFLGTFAVTVAMPLACSGPEWGGPSGGPTSASSSSGSGGSGGSGGGFDLKGPQVCTDYCLSYFAVCFPLAVQDCLDQCYFRSKEAGPECQDEFETYYGCRASWAASLPADVLCGDGPPSGCDSNPLSDCQIQYGCFSTGPCNPNWLDPNGGMACYCPSRCLDQYVNSLCWMEGAKQVCECRIQQVLVGTCEEPQVQACDNPRLNERCCNQYFMIPF